MGEEAKILLNFSKGTPTPFQLNTIGNLGKNWCEWRKYYLDFIKHQDPTESYKDKWGTYLLLFIGPAGQEAFNKFSFDKVQDKENLEVLLKKFDLHFIFGSRVKQQHETIDEYINNLMSIAVSNSSFCNIPNIVKEKVIQDIISANFMGEAYKYLQSVEHDLKTDFNTLNVKDIALIWKMCEKFQTSERSSQKRNSDINKATATECIRCGSVHSRNRCPAHGKQCAKCNKFNHFTEKCTVKYIEDCPKCGLSHIQSKCLAYGHECEKCGKSNHYSWKCQVPMVENCARCGTDHSKATCPAQGKLCTLCNKPNHFEKKCMSKENAG